jgi:hypothetical protein
VLAGVLTEEPRTRGVPEVAPIPVAKEIVARRKTITTNAVARTVPGMNNRLLKNGRPQSALR